jgi:metal-sulfur cluster biosynthetic enzyme
LIRGIRDPEHPLTLEQLGVVFVEGINVDHSTKTVSVEFTPTIPHCSQVEYFMLRFLHVL